MKILSITLGTSAQLLTSLLTSVPVTAVRAITFQASPGNAGTILIGTSPNQVELAAGTQLPLNSVTGTNSLDLAGLNVSASIAAQRLNVLVHWA